MPGVEPGISRPQREVLTTILHTPGEAGYRSQYLPHAKRALYHLSYIPIARPTHTILKFGDDKDTIHHHGKPRTRPAHRCALAPYGSRTCTHTNSCPRRDMQPYRTPHRFGVAVTATRCIRRPMRTQVRTRGRAICGTRLVRACLCECVASRLCVAVCSALTRVSRQRQRRAG